MAKDRGVRVKLRDKDEAYIELIRDAYGLSKSDILRAGVVSLAERLGVVKWKTPDNFLKRIGAGEK